MNDFADETMRFPNLSSGADLGIPTIIDTHRPNKTFICTRRIGKFVGELLAGQPLERTSRSFPLDIMGLTEATCAARLVAIWNRAYGSVSHSDLRERLAWLERVMGLPSLARSSFVHAASSLCKEKP